MEHNPGLPVSSHPPTPALYQVQRLEYQHDDAWVSASGRLPACEDAGSGLVLAATSTTLTAFLPVAMEQQVGLAGGWWWWFVGSWVGLATSRPSVGVGSCMDILFPILVRKLVRAFLFSNKFYFLILY